MNFLRSRKPKTRVEIFSKPACHLCDEVKEIILKVQEDTPFELQVVDITNDPGMFEEFKEQIPVVFINGRKAFKFRIDEKRFRKKLMK